jgi:hypothetical protein
MMAAHKVVVCRGRRIDRTARNLAGRLEREALLGPNPLQGMHFPELLLSKLLKVA